MNIVKGLAEDLTFAVVTEAMYNTPSMDQMKNVNYQYWIAVKSASSTVARLVEGQVNKSKNKKSPMSLGIKVGLKLAAVMGVEMAVAGKSSASFDQKYLINHLVGASVSSGLSTLI